MTPVTWPVGRTPTSVRPSTSPALVITGALAAITTWDQVGTYLDYIKKNIPMIKVGNAPEGTYLQWIDVTAIADKINAKKMAQPNTQTNSRGWRYEP